VPNRPWRRYRTSQPGATALKGVGAIPSAASPSVAAPGQIVVLERKPFLPRKGASRQEAEHRQQAAGHVRQLHRPWLTPGRLGDRRDQVAHRQNVRSAEFRHVPRKRRGIGQDLDDRGGDIGDIDRLAAPARPHHGHHRQGRDHSGEHVDEAAFAAEQDRGTNDDCLGKSVTYRILACRLGAAIFGRGLAVGPCRGDMDEAADPGRSSDPGRIGRPDNMQSAIVAAAHPNEIHHRVGAFECAREGLGLADVSRHELGLAEPAQGFEKKGLAGIALRNADTRAGREQFLRDIAAEKSATTNQRYQPVPHARLPCLS